MDKKYYGSELYHHGVEGMKWGQRLYQYEDGSLTPLGKARRQAQLRKKERAKEAKKKQAEKAKRKEEKRAQAEAKAEDRRALKEAREEAKRKQTKVVRVHDLSKYTDDELREKTNRLRVENEYLRAREEYARLNPRAISKGEKFKNYMKNTVGSAISEAVKNTGKAYAEKMLKKMLLPEEPKKTREDKIKEYGIDKMNDEELTNKVKRMASEDSYIKYVEGKKNNDKK